MRIRATISSLLLTKVVPVNSKGHMYDDARKTFRDIASKNLDWPEAIWEAWISFEQLHGTVDQIEEALDRVERAQVQVNNKRAKEAQKAQDAAAQLIAETQAAALPVQTETAPEPAAMEVDSGAPAEARAKRKAEDEGTPEPTKKARVGEQRGPIVFLLS